MSCLNVVAAPRRPSPSAVRARTRPSPDTVRGADVAYYSYERVPKGPLPRRKYLDVAPDLAVEVRSPGDPWSEILAKVAEYLRAGVKAVVVLDEQTRTLTIYRPDVPHQVLNDEAEFSLPDYPELLDTLPINRVVSDEYLNGNVDRVYMLWPRFVNTAVQTPVTRQLLPIEPEELTDITEEDIDYIYEPSPEGVFAELLPRYIEMTIYAAILENEASELSARMVAMRNATDSANEMIQTLTLIYNKARQEQITKELLDIVGGVEAMK